MAHKPSAKMINTPHIEAINFCRKCTHLAQAFSEGNNVNWGKLRNACRCCKTGQCGIYKADAIYDLYKLEGTLHNEIRYCREEIAKLKPFKPNKGRKATRYKTHGEVVNNLREQGFSLRDISHTTGLAVNTIRKILSDNK